MFKVFVAESLSSLQQVTHSQSPSEGREDRNQRPEVRRLRWVRAA